MTPTRKRCQQWYAVAALALTMAGLLSAQPREAPAWPTFSDRAGQLGIDFLHRASPTPEKYLIETMGSGVAMFDANGDGRLDLYFVNGAPLSSPMPPHAVPRKSGREYWNRLYVQGHDGRFEDVTEGAGVAGEYYGMGVATGDYDNDGDADLYVTAFPQNQLFRNDGRGRFTDVTAGAGVAASGWSSSAAFVDVDHDGLLDLLVVRYLEWSFANNPWCGERQSHRAYCHPDMFKGIAPILYLNEGHGRFRDVTAAAGLGSTHGKSLGIAVTDYDGDGKVDLAIANDSVRQFLYRNKGDGTFEERAMMAGAAVDEDGRVYAGMGIDAADYDNDGWPDLAITNLSNQMYAVYRNGGDGTFAYTTHHTGIGRMTILNSGWGLRFVDLDADGWKDLFIAQSHVLDTITKTSPHIAYEQPLLAARNTGAGTFENLSSRSGEVMSRPLAARGLATGDLDDDGDVDVVVTTTNGRPLVLLSAGTSRRVLTLQLQGTRSNRSAIGASVRVEDDSSASQYYTVTTTSSYLSASDPRLHIGFAQGRLARSVEVLWPSGARQRVPVSPGTRALLIVEPDSAAATRTAEVEAHQ